MPNPASSFAIAALDASKVEDPRGVTAYTFTVFRTGDASAAATLAYAVSGSGGNPATAADFTGGAFPGGTVSFAPGDTSQTVTVPVQGSPAARPDEGFTVTLSGPAGATVTQATAAGLIRTDDADTTPAAFLTKYAPRSNFTLSSVNPYATGFNVSGLFGKAGTVAVSNAAAGPFRAPLIGLGVGNAAIATAPAAGSTLALPAGYGALVAQGANPVALTDNGVPDSILVGNDAGDAFNSTGASTGTGAVLIGGAGNDVFSVSGNADIDAGTGQDTVFATVPATISISSTPNGGNSITAVLAGGNVKLSAAASTVFCGASDMNLNLGFNTASTVVGGDGHLTFYDQVSASCTVFGGEGGVTFASNDKENIIVGGSGALTVNALTTGSGQYWGYSGHDTISVYGHNDVLAGVSGDKLAELGDGTSTFVSLTGGVVMDSRGASGNTVFFGGSGGTDTFIASNNQQASGTSAIIVTGGNTSTVQLGNGKATVYANGSSTITSGAGSADLVFDGQTQFVLGAVAPGSTRTFALFNFVPGTEHISLQNYGGNAAAYALLNQVNAPRLHPNDPAGPDDRPAAGGRARRRRRVRVAPAALNSDLSLRGAKRRSIGGRRGSPCRPWVNAPQGRLAVTGRHRPGSKSVGTRPPGPYPGRPAGESGRRRTRHARRACRSRARARSCGAQGRSLARRTATVRW